MLLAREDINPNTPDIRSCRTPLARAAENGHVGVVKLLLGRDDINRNAPGPLLASGCTPLVLAAQSGHEGVVKLPTRISVETHIYQAVVAEKLSSGLHTTGTMRWLSCYWSEFTAFTTYQTPNTVKLHCPGLRRTGMRG